MPTERPSPNKDTPSFASRKRSRVHTARPGVANDSSVKHLHRLPRRGTRLRLGEVLLRSGAITAHQLAQALKEQQQSQRPLGEILVRLGFVTDDTMRQALG